MSVKDNTSKAVDKAFEEVVRAAAELHSEELSRELDELDASIPDDMITFSPKKEAKMRAMFNGSHIRRQRMIKQLSRVAGILLVLFLAYATFFNPSGEAWRVKIMHLVFDSDAPNSDYTFVERVGDDSRLIPEYELDGFLI